MDTTAGIAAQSERTFHNNSRLYEGLTEYQHKYIPLRQDSTKIVNEKTTANTAYHLNFKQMHPGEASPDVHPFCANSTYSAAGKIVPLEKAAAKPPSIAERQSLVQREFVPFPNMPFAATTPLPAER